jgi:hypothetical protein
MQLFDAVIACLGLALACGLATAQRHEEQSGHEARRCAWQLAQLGAGALRSAEALREDLAAGESPCQRLDAEALRQQGQLVPELPAVNSLGQALEAYACLKEGRTYGIALARGLPRKPRGEAGPEADPDVQLSLYLRYALPVSKALYQSFALPPAELPAAAMQPVTSQSGTASGASEPAQMLADFGLAHPGPGSVFVLLAGTACGEDADYLRRVCTPGLEDRSAMAAPLSLQGQAVSGAAGLQLLPLQQGRLVQAGRLIAGPAAFAEACQEASADAAGSLASLDGRLAFAWTAARHQPAAAPPSGGSGEGEEDSGTGQTGQTGQAGDLLACLASKPRTLQATPALFQPRDARQVQQGGLVPKPWCPRGSRPRLDLLPAASESGVGSAPGTHVLTRFTASAGSTGSSASGIVLSTVPSLEDARLEGFRASASDEGEAWRVRIERRRTSSGKSLANWKPLASWRGMLCQSCLVREAEWEEDAGASVLALRSCVPEGQLEASANAGQTAALAPATAAVAAAGGSRP